MKKVKKTKKTSLENKIHKAKFSGFRKLKDGSWAGSIDIDKELKAGLYKMALKENKLTISELLYQAKRRSNKTLDDCIVAAQFLRVLMNYVETIQGSSNEKVTE